MIEQLYVVIVLDNDEPYVWSSYSCNNDAICSAQEAAHETGFKCIIETVNLK